MSAGGGIRTERHAFAFFVCVLFASGMISVPWQVKAHPHSVRTLRHYSAQALLPNPQWIELGPRPLEVPSGTSTYGIGPFAGRITAVAVNSSNPSNIYVGAAQGGVWKSMDGGVSWVPMTDGQPSLATGAITISPDGKTIYVGTGEPNRDGSSYYGAGLLKSTDNGRSWMVLGANVFAGSAISSVVVSRQSQNHLVVSTTAASCCRELGYARQDPAGVGVFTSSDSGASWQRTLSAADYTGVAQVVADPSNSNTLYAGDFAATVWKSTDGGATWSKIMSNAQGSTSLKLSRVAVAVTPALQNTLFAAFVNETGALSKIIRYNTSTGTNSSLTSPPAGQNFPHTPCNNACTSHLLLAADPTNPSVLYFGGVDLYRSIDGGQSWTDLGGFLAGSSLHPDQHSLVFIPGQASTIIDANDGGLWKSTDRGTTWANLNAGLGAVQFVSAAASASSDNILFGGSLDLGWMKYTGSGHWSLLLGGDTGWTGLERSNSSIVYAEYPNLDFRRSNDGGASWVYASTGIDKADSSLFYNPVAQDPNKPGTLYLGSNRIYKSTNYGQSWTPISGRLTPNSISAIAVAQSNSQVIYVGDSYAGNIWVTTDGGSSWAQVLTPNSNLASVSSIAVDPQDPSTAYASFATQREPRLVETTNSGSSWQPVSLTALPAVAVNVVRLDPITKAVYLGTDSGVYMSTDRGARWAQAGSGLPNAAVYDLAFTASDYLIAATHGRGVWELMAPAVTTTTTTTSSSSSSTSNTSTPTTSATSTTTATTSTTTATSSSSGSITTASTSQTSTSTSTTGTSTTIPEFPEQLIMVTLIIAIFVGVGAVIRLKGKE